jgi:hypothetical protein
VKLRLVHAATLKVPALRRTGIRVHLGFNLQQQIVDKFSLTERRGSESLRRLSFAPGELVLGDCGYAQRPGLFSVVQAGAHFVVNYNWWRLPLTRLDGEPLSVVETVRSLPDAQPRSYPVLIQAARDGSTPAFPGWLAVVRKSSEAARQSQNRVFRTCSRQQRSFDLDALELTRYTCLITSLAPKVLSCNAVLDLYRFRWQIERVFERLNGLLTLEHVPPSDPQLWCSFFSAKLLAALILSDYSGRYLASFPWGYRLGEPPAVAPAD